jgi:hypothetical protein
MTKKSSKRPVWFNGALLDDLANLSEGSLNLFKRSWGDKLKLGSDSELLVFRDRLRMIWSPSESLQNKERILGSWLHSRKQGFEALGDFPLQPCLRLGVLIPKSGELAPALVFLALRYFRAMRLCINPDCDGKYFLAGRKHQVTCQKIACVRYAQAQRSKVSYHKRRKERFEEQAVKEL